MKKIYPLLVIGDNKDAYNMLNTGLYRDELDAVLDCTVDLPSRSWKKDKTIELKKLGFGEGKSLPAAKLRKAMDFIQDQRSRQNGVLVCSKDANVPMLVSLAYLVHHKGLAVEEAAKKIGSELDEPTKTNLLKSLAGVERLIEKEKKENAPVV